MLRVTTPTAAKFDGSSLNAGFLMPGAPDSYSLTFTASGAYTYLCLIHSYMQGTIVVLPKDAAIPSKAEQAAAAKLQLSSLLAESDTAPHEATYTANKDGSLTYNVDPGTLILNVSNECQSFGEPEGNAPATIVG